MLTPMRIGEVSCANARSDAQTLNVSASAAAVDAHTDAEDDGPRKGRPNSGEIRKFLMTVSLVMAKALGYVPGQLVRLLLTDAGDLRRMGSPARWHHSLGSGELSWEINSGGLM